MFLVAFGLAVLTIGLMIAPVAMHRFLFGRHQKDVLVQVGDRIAKFGLAALGLTLVAVTVLIFERRGRHAGGRGRRRRRAGLLRVGLGGAADEPAAPGGRY